MGVCESSDLKNSIDILVWNNVILRLLLLIMLQYRLNNTMQIVGDTTWDGVLLVLELHFISAIRNMAE